MKPWPDNTIALVCCLKGDPHYRPIAGSTEKPCFNCEQTVLISPATLASANNAEIICLPCYKQYTEGKPHLLLRTEEQLPTPKVLDAPSKILPLLPKQPSGSAFETMKSSSFFQS